MKLNRWEVWRGLYEKIVLVLFLVLFCIFSIVIFSLCPSPSTLALILHKDWAPVAHLSYSHSTGWAMPTSSVLLE